MGMILIDGVERWSKTTSRRRIDSSWARGPFSFSILGSPNDPTVPRSGQYPPSSPHTLTDVYIRFLTPPPQSLLLGASWYGVSYSRTSRSAVVLVPPEVSMTISTFPDSPSVPITTEWMHSSGQMISPQQISSLTASDRIYSGRSVAKALYVSTASDPKRSKVVRVRVQVATKAGPGAQNLGVFWGLPMTVISKPSKKRQSAEGFSESRLCLPHSIELTRGE